MSTTLRDYLTAPGDPVLYTPEFRAAIRAYYPTLKELNTTSVYTLTPDEVQQYAGDMTSYLLSKLIGIAYHWIALELSGFSDFIFHSESLMTIYAPSDAEINRFLAMYKMSN